MRDFKSKLVLLTGAASGIGRETSLLLCEEGADLVLVDINGEGLESVAREVESRRGKAAWYLADLRDASEVFRLHQEVTSTIGTPDVLVNVAGVAIVGCAGEIPLENWHRVIDINLWGCIHVVQFFLPDMIRKGGGQIINVASGAGLFSVPYQSPYVTSKFAVVGFSEALRQELSRYGIGVSVVCPGAINTPIIETATCLGFGEPNVKKVAYGISAKPEKMAQAIIRGARKNRPVIIYPFYIRLIYGLKRVSPRAADISGRAFARTFYWQNREV